MGRSTPTGLQALLDLPSCNTHTTVSIYPVSGAPLHFATDDFTAEGNAFADSLRKCDQLRQSISAASDRVVSRIQNVDKTFGQTVTTESLVKAQAVVGRYYRDEADLEEAVTPGVWTELFRGEVIPLEINQLEAALEIVHDLIAAGYCVANWTLADLCQFVFGHAGTCGYVGAETTCNKRRKSPLGCKGRDNEDRFGGMEYPVVKAAAPPTGGSGGGGGGWSGGCPRLDQWVLVLGRQNQPVPRRVRELSDTDLLFHPAWGTFHRIKAATVHRSVKIWEIATVNGAAGFSSFSHPVLWYREHITGEAVKRFLQDDPVLTWSNGLQDTKAATSRDTGETGDVLKIEMDDGHIYCYSDKKEGPFIACHNAKPILD